MKTWVKRKCYGLSDVDCGVMSEKSKSILGPLQLYEISLFDHSNWKEIVKIINGS